MLNKELVNEVVEIIEVIIDGMNSKVIVNEVVKNNNTKLTGVCIMLENENIFPTVYLENYDLTSSNVREVAVQIISDSYRARLEMPKIDTDKLLTPEYIKNNAIIRLINYKANEEMLRTTPHIRFFDLAIVCYVNVGYNGAIRLDDNIFKTLYIPKDELFYIANTNTQNIFSPKGRNMEEIFFGIESKHKELSTFNMDNPLPMYVLTNAESVYGATTILYDGLLEELSNQTKTDLIIIPSSVHEVILVPKIDGVEVDKITEMVQEVNGGQVAPEERLSDHAYIYNRFTGQIEMN